MASERIDGVEFTYDSLVLVLDLLPFPIAVLDLRLDNVLQEESLFTGLIEGSLVDLVVLDEFSEHVVVALDGVEQFLGLDEGGEMAGLLVGNELIERFHHVQLYFFVYYHYLLREFIQNIDDVLAHE